MPWEKSSADLVEFFRSIVPTGADIQVKPMFGYQCAFIHGKLFTGLFRQSIVFRLAPADCAAFLDQPGTREFEPMPGHKMSGFVLLDDPFAAAENELVNWIQCAKEFAAKLPAKKGRKKTAKKSAKNSIVKKSAATKSPARNKRR